MVFLRVAEEQRANMSLHPLIISLPDDHYASTVSQLRFLQVCGHVFPDYWWVATKICACSDLLPLLTTQLLLC